MTRILRLALAAALTAAFAVPVPASVPAKASCCGESCPMPSKKAPAKAAKCCWVAPAAKLDEAVSVPLTVVARPSSPSVTVVSPRAVLVFAVLSVPPADVFDEAPSGLSPPARA